LKDRSIPTFLDFTENPFLIAYVVLQGGWGKGKVHFLHEGIEAKRRSMGFWSEELPGVQIRGGPLDQSLPGNLHHHFAHHPGLTGQNVTGLHLFGGKEEGGACFHLALLDAEATTPANTLSSAQALQG
jgi:hypothetical protein